MSFFRFMALLLALSLAACQPMQVQTPAPTREAGNSPGTSSPGGDAGSNRPPEPVPEAPGDAREAIDSLRLQAEQYVADGEWQKAIAMAEHGLRLDRRHAPFYRLLAESYRGVGDIQAAESFARQALRFCGDHCAEERALLRSLGNP